MNINFKFLLLGLGLSSAVVLNAQPVINNPANQNAAGANSQQYWSRQGNTNQNGLNNVFGTQYNSQVWSITNGFYRMMMDNGLGGNTDGSIGMGNNLPSTFAPVDRLHLYQSGGTTAMRFSNTATGLTATDGFQIGILALGGAVIRDFDLNRNILIGTNDGGTGSFDRIRIGSFAENGFIGMGTVNAFPSPRALLHLTNFAPNMATPLLRGELFRTDGENSILNAWRLYTGPNAIASTEKFSVRVPLGSNNAELYTTNGDMLFYTNGQQLGDQQRMRISSGIGNQVGVQQPNATKVNISYGAGYAPIAFPVAMLNIGFDAPQGPVGGQRNWMDVGTFTCANSDNMYVGLKNEALNGNFGSNNNDRMDAVINWGDNNGANSQFGPDNMRFIFTEVQNPATTTGPASNDGLEAMRISPVISQNGTLMFVGIGGDPATNLYSAGGIYPTNTLEVNSQNPTNVPGGSSGLRFTNLNTSSPTINNPGQGVLAVNNSGDIIYVPAPTGVTFGGACGNTNNMTSDWSIPMAGFNYVFTGQGATGYNVGIGMPTGNCTPNAKLDVRQVSGNANSIGVSSTNADIDGTALKVRSTGNATFTQTKVAGYFEATPSFGNQQVAIYVPQVGGVVNIGYPTSNSGQPGLLNVNGAIYMNGQIVQTSDASIKTNVATIQNSYAIIGRLRPVSYNYTTAAISDSTMLGTHYGLIAQEVDTVLSDIVHEGSNGLKSVSYMEIIPYLVAALQNEHTRNDSLAAEISMLTATVNGCCAANSRTQQTVNTTDVELSNSESIVLDQNVPNPFAEQTVINYNLPQTVQKAQILFYDAQGKLIKAVDLSARGKGQINVFANDLSNGIYTYALVVDGQVADSKKMVKTN